MIFKSPSVGKTLMMRFTAGSSNGGYALLALDRFGVVDGDTDLVGRIRVHGARTLAILSRSALK
jgi:hypothetical protein